MSKESKPFVIATEGQTTDGRNISREWLAQMAKNYKPEIFTAVVNLEHILSLLPDSPFSAYGKVKTLATRETEIFGQKRLQLTATVEAHDAAVKIQQEGKKCFASMEVVPNFTGRGEAYLTGLALTDTPASLGTEPMRFSAISSGKKEDIYAFAGETELDFKDTHDDEDAQAGRSNESAPPSGSALLEKVKELLGMKSRDAQGFSDLAHAIETLALSQKELLNRQSAQQSSSTRENAELQTKIKTLANDLTSLKTQLAATESGTKRPSANGGAGLTQTDC
jgi:hypothetical protein